VCDRRLAPQSDASAVVFLALSLEEFRYYRREDGLIVKERDDFSPEDVEQFPELKGRGSL
jgi:hypothetical protein